MKRCSTMKQSLKRIPVWGLLWAVCIISLALQPITASGAGEATRIPVLWSAGGVSAGTDGAGQAARIASDASGNVAVVSGPSGGRDLAVTSYRADGMLRWRSTITPSTGTFVGDWVVAATNSDFVVIGHNQDSHGRPIAGTMLRYDTDGALLWRVDFSAGSYPTVARLLVDAAGNAYLAWSAVGNGFFVQKYSPHGALLWSQQDSATGGGYAVASSLALSADGLDIAVTGSIPGGATWITAVHDAATGVRRWQTTAAEGTAALDVVMDATCVYVTGQGAAGMTNVLTVVAYDRATGARLWRSDKKPADGTSATGLRMAMAPDGNLVVTGQVARGFLDWYTVAFSTTGAVQWEAVRDGGLNTDEIPRGVAVMADGTTVVTGRGGPNLPGGYWPGVTAGYGPSGNLLWEAFSAMETTWITPLPNGNICASGGYDALVTCFRVPGTVRAVISATPPTGTAPLSVTFDGSGSTSAQGTLNSWAWSFGDGVSGTGALASHVYQSPGTYTASLAVTDSNNASSSATSSIVVTPAVNRPPTAVMLATPSTGAAPLSVTFSSAGSNDPDGAIASYLWNFGDATTSTATNPSHIYASSGTYTATLMVTDNGGYTASKSVTINVIVAKVLRSSNIVLSATRQPNAVTATGKVTVTNEAGSPCQGATVSAIWTLPSGATKSQTATTNSSGIATFTVKSIPGTYSLQVANITKTGNTFDPINSVLSKSITK